MKKNDILLLVASAFLLVVAWVGFSIYHNLATSTVVPTVGQQLIPIPPSFDTKTINALKTRTAVNPNFTALSQGSSESASPSPTPALSITPTASPSVQIATGSANQSSAGGTIKP